MDAKKLFLNSMVELMKEYSFEEITVARILEKSTLSRSTFYRNFRDKYDLLNYYYKSGVVGIFENEHYDSWEQYLRAIYSLMLDNYAYYKRLSLLTLQTRSMNFCIGFRTITLKRPMFGSGEMTVLTSRQRLSLDMLRKDRPIW